jgi:hypothetical protein
MVCTRHYKTNKQTTNQELLSNKDTNLSVIDPYGRDLSRKQSDKQASRNLVSLKLNQTKYNGHKEIVSIQY